MKVGFGIPNNQGVEDPNDLMTLAVTAERLGYASVWVREHLFHSTYVAERLGNKPYHDALTVLTAIACATETVRLGTSVLVCLGTIRRASGKWLPLWQNSFGEK